MGLMAVEIKGSGSDMVEVCQWHGCGIMVVKVEVECGDRNSVIGDGGGSRLMAVAMMVMIVVVVIILVGSGGEIVLVHPYKSSKG